MHVWVGPISTLSKLSWSLSARVKCLFEWAVPSGFFSLLNIISSTLLLFTMGSNLFSQVLTKCNKLFEKIMRHKLYAAPKPKVTFFDPFLSWRMSSGPLITKLNFCTLLMRSAIFTGFLTCLLFKSFTVKFTVQFILF